MLRRVHGVPLACRSRPHHHRRYETRYRSLRIDTREPSLTAQRGSETMPRRRSGALAAARLQEAGCSRASRIEVGHGPFETLRWSNLRTLIAARDEVIVRRLARGDVGGAMRDAWLGALSSRPDPRVPIALVPDAGPTVRVLLAGDTGDASESQRAVARQLAGRARAPGAAMQTATVAAVLIESDIVHPAGSSDEFSRKFFDVYDTCTTWAPDLCRSRQPRPERWVVFRTAPRSRRARATRSG
jgi:hypothetical protein